MKNGTRVLYCLLWFSMVTAAADLLGTRQLETVCDIAFVAYPIDTTKTCREVLPEAIRGKQCRLTRLTVVPNEQAYRKHVAGQMYHPAPQPRAEIEKERLRVPQMCQLISIDGTTVLRWVARKGQGSEIGRDVFDKKFSEKVTNVPLSLIDIDFDGDAARGTRYVALYILARRPLDEPTAAQITSALSERLGLAQSKMLIEFAEVPSAFIELPLHNPWFGFSIADTEQRWRIFCSSNRTEVRCNKRTFEIAN